MQVFPLRKKESSMLGPHCPLQQFHRHLLKYKIYDFSNRYQQPLFIGSSDIWSDGAQWRFSNIFRAENPIITPNCGWAGKIAFYRLRKA